MLPGTKRTAQMRSICAVFHFFLFKKRSVYLNYFKLCESISLYQKFIHTKSSFKSAQGIDKQTSYLVYPTHEYD